MVGEAERLAPSLLPRIAREFNQSETTFVMPPSTPEADWRLRSFTAAGVEVFGAGHNALGAWWWLAATGRLTLDQPRVELHQELGSRVLPVAVESTAGRPTDITMTQGPPEFGTVFDRPATLASALGLTEPDLIPALPAQVVSTGTPHLLVGVLRAALFRAQPHPTKLSAVLKKAHAQGCYLYTIEATDPGVAADARFFNPTVGIAEDAATGSAAGPLACYIKKISPKTGPTIVIAQGAAMGRPSRLTIELRENQVQLRGVGVVVVEGTLSV